MTVMTLAGVLVGSMGFLFGSRVHVLLLRLVRNGNQGYLQLLQLLCSFPGRLASCHQTCTVASKGSGHGGCRACPIRSAATTQCPHAMHHVFLSADRLLCCCACCPALLLLCCSAVRRDDSVGAFSFRDENKLNKLICTNFLQSSGDLSARINNNPATQRADPVADAKTRTLASLRCGFCRNPTQSSGQL